jgi:hypothetical protein
MILDALSKSFIVSETGVTVAWGASPQVNHHNRQLCLFELNSNGWLLHVHHSVSDQQCDHDCGCQSVVPPGVSTETLVTKGER